jgi:hypothetical protein
MGGESKNRLPRIGAGWDENQGGSEQTQGDELQADEQG